MYKKLYNFFDKLEDKVRGFFSHYPIVYGLIAGVGIVLFWRGVWHTVDFVSEYYFSYSNGDPSLRPSFLPWWDGPLSLCLGVVILLMIGAFVSSFIGNEIIISGLRGEKKLTERTESEMRHEVGAIADIQEQVRGLSEKLEGIEKKIK